MKEFFVMLKEQYFNVVFNEENVFVQNSKDSYSLAVGKNS